MLEFYEKVGLVFGVYDFLECGGDIIFLECNFGGVWFWLEYSFGFNVFEYVVWYFLGRDEIDFFGV